MHGAISAALPAAALATKFGSAKNGRARLTISAHPLEIRSSATSGVFIRLLVMIGIDVFPISFLVTQAKAARGTEVAMAPRQVPLTKYFVWLRRLTMRP